MALTRLISLSYFGGKAIRTLIAEVKTPNDNFVALTKIISKKFNPTVNIQMNIFNFQSVSQATAEKFDEFFEKLKEKASRIW